MTSDRAVLREKLLSIAQLYYMQRQAGGQDVLTLALRAKAIMAFNRLRASYRSRTGRLEAADFIDGHTRLFLEDALAQGPEAHAFDVLEGLRARTLLDQMDAAPARLFPESISDRINALEKEVLSFAADEADSEGWSRSLNLASRLTLARPELIDEVEALLAREGGGFTGMASVVALSEVANALQAQEVAIEFCIPTRPLGPARYPTSLWALIITRDFQRRVRLLEFQEPGGSHGRIAVDGRAGVDFSPLTHLVSRITQAIRADAPEQQAELEQAYEILIAPLIAAGVDPQVYRHWIVVPDSSLHSLPFAALRRPAGGFLGAELALSIVPSLSVWFRQQRPYPPLRRFLGFGNPQVAGRAPLRFAEYELQEVSRLLVNRGLQCQVKLGAEATESLLKELALGQNLLHIAAHGALATADAFDFHDLLLAGTAADDGRLHAHELRELDLREVSLAVLSVCDSGTYRFGSGNELHGLVASLIIAGVRDVLGTLWPIDDALASRLMVRFYSYLLRQGPAEALRRARADLIAQGATARDWASFLVVGPGRAPAPVAAAAP